MKKPLYWLLRDDGEYIHVIDYGTLDVIQLTFNALTEGCSYIRQWVEDGMTYLDYGSHRQMYRIYPAVDLFNPINFKEEPHGLQG